MINKSTIELIHKFLKLQGKYIDCIKIYQIYSKHPLPYSIRAYSDVLDELGIENIVCCINLDQLYEVPIPPILYLKNQAEPFHMFCGFDKNNDVILESNGKRTTIKKDVFVMAWDGIILYDRKL
jgi:hypothetical protein